MNTLKTVDANTLLSTPLKPIHFIVDGLIPTGPHILGGSPKIGKSWLMLWLCLKVSQGEQVWEYTTNQCSVLYLALEDTYSRLQQRLFLLTDSAPEHLRFGIGAELLNSGLQKQIESYIKTYPDTKLVVIDTLQRVRNILCETNAYANDYKDLTELKQLADNLGIALIIVHHLRKQDSSDPFMKLSGTTGISGAVDSTWVLEKDKRYSDTAKLYITGRDVDYQEITLKFEDCIWQFVSCEKSKEIMKRDTPNFLFRLVDFISR